MKGCFCFTHRTQPKASLWLGEGPVGRPAREWGWARFCLLLLLPIFLFNSCATLKKSTKKGNIPRAIVVLPLENQSQDFTAPYLIQYFLERELRKKGFVLPAKYDEVREQLRKLGILQGNQITSENIQQAGQFLKAEAVLHGVLADYRQDPIADRTVARALFQITEVWTGRLLWETKVELNEKGLKKTPIRGVISSEFTYQEIRSVARGKTGKLPKKIAREALKSLPK